MKRENNKYVRNNLLLICMSSQCLYWNTNKPSESDYYIQKSVLMTIEKFSILLISIFLIVFKNMLV